MCINQPPVIQSFLHNLFTDSKMHLPGFRLNGAHTQQESRTHNKENGEVFTVCTQCKKVLLPSRKNSAPPSIRISREEDDQWVNFEDISNLHAVPALNLSHGLCASCFQKMDDSLPHLPHIIARNVVKSTSSPQLSPKHHLSTTASTRILVVDDNKLQRQIHKRMVEQAGFQCDVASSGPQAIEMVQKHSYSLILMDLMMGDTDGWSTSKTIRKILLQTVGYGGLPRIIAVTGLHVDSKLISECAAAGMDEILQKPVSPAILNRILSKYAGQS